MVTEDDYMSKLFAIGKELNANLSKLQDELTQEELIEFIPHFNFFIYALIEDAVGKELIVHYLIDLLNLASKKQYSENNLKTASIDRYEKIKENNKKFKQRGEC